MSDADLRLEAPQGSKASMLLWVLAKRLKFMGVHELNDLIVSKVRMKSLAATARPIEANELLEFFGLEQIQNEWKTWRERLAKLGKVFQSDVELNNFLLTFFREEIMQRDSYQCFLCAKPLSPLTASLHHILWDKGIFLNVPSNLITFCAECHRNMGCGEAS